ncbi:hypothetical protein C8F01DRAFT_1368924 [Mycena amicta]|nr:hypothetical protein C8F01DRAFT_1368924 [Mycena amicta]
MDAFPPELIDYALDFLHDDHPSLRTSSLVCRAWVPASRFHLFQHISISSTHLAFLMLLEAEQSGFCTFPSTHLTLGNLDPTPEEGYAYHILRRRLPGLTSITFHNWTNLGKQPLHELLPHYTRLTEIKLHVVAFHHYEDLFRFLGLCPPSLETLDIMFGAWGSGSETFGADEPFPAACSVKTLRLRNCFYADILDHFVASAARLDAPLQCSTLELTDFPGDPNSTARFLASAGPALKHLIVEFSEDYYGDSDQAANDQAHDFLTPIDLSKNPNLQTLSLKNTFAVDGTYTRFATAVPRILRSLSTGTHPLLDVVRFNLAVYMPHEMDDFFGWEQVDEALDGIGGLQRVECSVSSVDDEQEDEDSVVVRIVKRLPRMARRGCLVFIY